jgi:hypothetical protein
MKLFLILATAVPAILAVALPAAEANAEPGDLESENRCLMFLDSPGDTCLCNKSLT